MGIEWVRERKKERGRVIEKDIEGGEGGTKILVKGRDS